MHIVTLADDFRHKFENFGLKTALLFFKLISHAIIGTACGCGGRLRPSNRINSSRGEIWWRCNRCKLGFWSNDA